MWDFHAFGGWIDFPTYKLQRNFIHHICDQFLYHIYQLAKGCLITMKMMLSFLTIADLVWTIVSQKRSAEKLRQAKDQLMEQQRELAKTEERQRTARDLHSVNQSINSMVLFSETLASTLEKKKFERTVQIMECLQESARQLLKRPGCFYMSCRPRVRGEAWT